MSLLFLVLKFIGLGIGIIFALILAVTLFVLLWPVKYNIRASYLAGALHYDIEVSWFMKLLLIRFANNPGEGIKIFRLAFKDFLKKKNADESSPPEKKEPDSISDSDNNSNISQSEVKSPAKEDTVKSDSDDSTDGGAFDRLRSIIHTAKTAYNNPDKSDIIRESIILLKRLAKAIKTKVFNISCEIGFETPDVTGYALGGLSILKAILDRKGRNIYIKGNFNEEIINVECEIKGTLKLWSALWPLVVFVFTKPIWKMVKEKLFKRKKK